MTTIANHRSNEVTTPIPAPDAVMSSPDAVARQCASTLLATIPLIMRQIASTTRTHLAEAQEPMTFRQVQLIEVLAKHDMSLSDLSTMHAVTPSAMSRSVDVLVRRGWIARRDDTRDRRQVSLSLTAQGERVRQRLRTEYEDVFAQRFGGVGGEQRQAILRGLQAVQQALQV